MRTFRARIIGMVCLCLGLWLITVAASAQWSGVDETVVEKFAEQAHRPPAEPLLNLEGDLGLFVFLLAGVFGGFIGGYYFRELFPPRRRPTVDPKHV